MMKNYARADSTHWAGRLSGKGLYLHEKIEIADLLDPGLEITTRAVALLGYACDAGVARNQGRPGAAQGPQAIREVFGRLPNHLAQNISLLDAGNISCPDAIMEDAQQVLTEAVDLLYAKGIFPIVLGGGHDLSYGHFKGLQGQKGAGRTGIINFDAHFDLRSNLNGNNSGTPFYQLATELGIEGQDFNYLCLGIRKDANDRILFETAEAFGVHFIEREDFSVQEITTVQMGLLAFMDKVEAVYVTIDLDGFSSAYAPGVSAPSPMGFSPDIVWESLKIVIDSGKLIGLDVAELNPSFDIDKQTARLAASLLHAIIHRWALL
jgi:formiminoglutamase